jgi:uncharacterized protein (DUF2141 family)
MIVRRWILAACTALSLASPASLMAGRSGQRDVSIPAMRTPARLSGVVVTTDATPQPVRRAIVSMSGSDQPLGRHTITDDEGHFVFDALPAGRYMISAARSSYVTIAYGAVRPGRPGTPLVIGPGEQVANLPVLLARGAVITGTVRDGTDEPLVNYDVRVDRRNGNVAGVPSTISVKTDDEGVYRVFGLPAGTYVISARPQRTGGGDLYAPSDAQVEAALRELKQGHGSTPPVGVGARTPPAAVPATAALPMRAYDLAPVYYTSAITLDDATPVTVVAGEERLGVDIRMQLVSTWAVAGTIGVPDELRNTVLLTLTTTSALGTPVTRTSQVNAAGTFRFGSVAPGRYVLAAQVRSTAVSQVATGAPSAQAAASEMAGACAFANQDVSIGGSDLTGLSLVLRPCLKVAGRLVFAGTSLPPDITKLRVTLLQFAPSGVPTMSPLRWQSPSVAGDGTFIFGEFRGVLPGTYALSVDVPSNVAGRGWALRSATADGRDILDAPFELTGDSQATTTTVLTFSDQHASLSGVLETPTRQPAVAYTVVAFTTNRMWWSPPFRRVRDARPATDGRFMFQDLPPGAYYLAALTDVGPDDLHDPDFLGQLVPAAIGVTVGAGEQKVQNLRLAGGG